jgi:zinc-ribbon domain
MSGLLRRLTRRRPATADENRSPATASSEPVAAPAETPAEPGGGQPVPAEQPTVLLPATTEQPAVPAQPLPAWTVAADQPTAFAYAAQPAPARDLPAGVDPADLAAAPAASSRRGKLRRRLRYLRHVRELLLRDLGGFTYEIHRTAGGTAQEPQRRLATAKAQRITTLDAEVRALESRLGEPHETLLREPGIGGTCPECGELHASDAHFCSRCGTALDEKARAQRAAEQPTTGTQSVVEPQPASVLWAGGPRPAPEPSAAEQEDVAEPPASVTSQWLATDQPTTFSRAAQPAKANDPAPEPPTAEAPVAEPDEAAPPKPATAAARAKPKRAAKPRKPAKRAPAKPRAAAPPAEDAKPAAEGPAPPADEPKPAEPESEAPKPEDPASFEANGRRDEDVPPPLSSGDPLAAPREQRP